MGISCRFCCRNCRTFCWCPRISAFRRLSTLWLLFRCATSLRTAEAAASSGEGVGRRRGVSEASPGCSGASGSSSASSSMASPSLFSSAPSCSASPSDFSPGWLATACAHCRLPSTAAMAADMAAFDALAAANDALTAAPTKRSAAAVPLAAVPSCGAGAGACSSAAVVSVTSAQASAAFSASRPRLIAVTERSAQVVALGFRFAATRHCAATSSVA
mmetsp:Transcript_10286/g.31959  ORF Transcript_10286/g.31959 Transcript_10286/m.31959 type:complete len:217 (-) Transcript_10286:1243-1893(-)